MYNKKSTKHMLVHSNNLSDCNFLRLENFKYDKLQLN